MSYTMEDFRREYAHVYQQERLLLAKEFIKLMPPEELIKLIPPEEILKRLPIDEIEKYWRRHTKAASSSPNSSSPKKSESKRRDRGKSKR